MHARTVHMLLGVALTGAGSPAGAHHSNAPFSLNDIVTFEATVTRFEWKNPHVFIHVERLNADGELYTIQVEGDGISILKPLGWSADALAPGDRVTVEANPPRDPSRPAVLGRKVFREDGSVLYPNPEFIDAPTPASEIASRNGIAGVWLPRREDFYATLGSVTDWSLTDKGQAFLDGYDGTQNIQANCIPVSSPVIMVYMVHTEIEVRDNRVLIHSDWMDTERVVYTDGREHPVNGERTLQGYSIGHWEGDALVMDTRLFSEHPGGLVIGIPAGTQKRIIERLTPTDDGTALIYEFEVSDPEYLREPATGSSRWNYRPDLERSGSPCDLEAAQRFLEQP